MLTLADLGILRDVERRGRHRDRHDHPDLLGLPGDARDARRPACAALGDAGFADVEVRHRAQPGRGPATGSPPRAAASWPTPASPRRRRRAAAARPDPADPQPAGRPVALPALRVARTPSGPPRSARPRARRCTAAAPASSRSSTSRRSDGDRRSPTPAHRGFHPLTVAGSSGSATTRPRSPSRCPANCATASPSGRPVADPAPDIDGRDSAGRTRSARPPGRAAHRRARGARAGCSPAGWSARSRRATRSRSGRRPARSRPTSTRRRPATC